MAGLGAHKKFAAADPDGARAAARIRRAVRGGMEGARVPRARAIGRGGTGRTGNKQARWPAPGRPARAASLAGSAAAGSRPWRMSNASAAGAQLAPGHGGRGTVAQVGLPPAWGSLLAVWGLPVRLATHDPACDLHSLPLACPTLCSPVCGSLIIEVQTCSVPDTH